MIKEIRRKQSLVRHRKRQASVLKRNHSNLNITVSTELVENMGVIRRKYPVAPCNLSSHREEAYELAADLFSFASFYRSNEEFVEFIKKARDIAENKELYTDSRVQYANKFLVRVQRLDTFFEFHSERGYPIKDWRTDLLLKLRSDAIAIWSFLKARRKKQ